MLSTIVNKVTNIFLSAGSTDAIDLLKNDHRTVEGLFEKVKANEDGNNASVFKKIKAELDTHTHIEETIFYPYLLEKGDEELKKIVREGIEEHRQAKAFLSELAGSTGTSDKFKAKIKVLMEDIEHHVQEEEGEMFPMVRDQFSSDVINELGARMEAEKTAFKGSSTRAARKRRASRAPGKKAAAARS
jgi:hemerythrin superfamily protein